MQFPAEFIVCILIKSKSREKPMSMTVMRLLSARE